MIDNSFFKQVEKGPAATMHISEAIECLIGPRLFFSKRLAPPMTLCNGRIYADEQYVFSSDLEIPKITATLHRLAKFYNVKISVFCETGEKPYWTSEEPTMWFGFAKVNGKVVDKCLIKDALPYYTKLAQQTRKQWFLDHDVVRPAPKQKKIKLVKKVSNLEKCIRNAMAKKKK